MSKKEKSWKEAQLAFTLPPPVYGYHLSTDAGAASKQIKIVSSILDVPGGIKITALTGEAWVVPTAQIKFLVEE